MFLASYFNFLRLCLAYLRRWPAVEEAFRVFPSVCLMILLLDFYVFFIELKVVVSHIWRKEIVQESDQEQNRKLLSSSLYLEIITAECPSVSWPPI